MVRRYSRKKSREGTPVIFLVVWSLFILALLYMIFSFQGGGSFLTPTL